MAHALLKAGHEVVGLVRSQERAEQAKRFGITPAIGDLNDSKGLTELAAAADAVINTADADHRPAVEAILAALQGTRKVFVHTSGSGIVADCAGGEATTAIYEDDTPVKPLPARVARVALNDTILAAAKDGIRTSIIAPTMIYGRGRGVNPNSIQIPRMINVARKLGVSQYIGRGANIWSNVQVEDLADLYVKGLAAAPAGAFYYAENGELSMIEICRSINRMLGFDGAPAAMTLAEGIAEFGEGPANFSFGSNSRVRAIRARRELAWSPIQPSLQHDIERGSYAQAAPSA